MWVSHFRRSEDRALGISRARLLAGPSVSISVVPTTNILARCFHWAPLLLLCSPSMGCEGRITTDALAWSCGEACSTCPVVWRPPSLAGAWRFDDQNLGAEWRSSHDTELRWVACDDGRGGEWVTGDARSGWCGTERLGGMGGSLRLQGDGYLEAALPEILSSGPVTLAVWVSVHRASTERMTVVSLVRPACASAWLDLEVLDGQHRLLLQRERGAAGEGCLVEQWSTQLPSSFFDWGLGTWYHLSAVLQGDDDPVLFLDGSPLPGSASAEQVASNPAAGSGLYIGVDPAKGKPFEGLVDDLALFSRALTAGEIRDIMLDAISVRSDPVSWTAWSVAGSRASWASDCLGQPPRQHQGGAVVEVESGYWSAGGLLARIEGGQRIGRLRKATLVADIPQDKSFDFVLAGPHNAERCTWNRSGRGKSRYEFSLADVNNCDCPRSCGCTFEVAEARVGTRWDESGPLRLAACRVELEWEDSAGGPGFDLAPGPGGDQGLNGWCWRPVSYHPGASVELDEELTSSERTVGSLGGSNRVTAFLAADFAVDTPGRAPRLCDLSRATEIVVEAAMPEGYSYQFRVADYTGIAREWSRQWHQDQPVQKFALCTSDESDGDCGRNVDPIPHQQRSVDLTRIRYLGFQKTFELNAEQGAIAIERVEFGGEASGNCDPASKPIEEVPR